MPDKPFQFRLSALVWLVVASAFVFAVIRFATSGAPGRWEKEVRAKLSGGVKSLGVNPRVADELALMIMIMCVASGPIAFLYIVRGRRRVPRRLKQPRHAEPAAPIEMRLNQFLANVSPVEPVADPAKSAVILPDEVEGKPARARSDIAGLLGRIRESVTSGDKPKAP